MTVGSNRFASVASRLALVAFGLGLSLVLLEIILRAGAAYNQRVLGPGAETLPGRATRIICLGDSNTYGQQMPRQATYPAFLGQMLKADDATSSIEVLNLGVPGTNSSRLRSQTSKIIETFRPDTLLVMIGVNDFWTVPAPIADEGTTWRQRLWAHSRVYRLFYMLLRSFERDDVEVILEKTRDGQPRGLLRHGDTQIDLSWTGRKKGQAWPQKLIDNIEAMADAARQHGVRFMLLTYPSEADIYGQANRIIRTAAASGIPLIDLGSYFLSVCTGGSCPHLFLPDHHPTMQGYQVAAVLVWRKIREGYGLAAAEEKPPTPGHLLPLTALYLRRIDKQQSLRVGTSPRVRRDEPVAGERADP